MMFFFAGPFGCVGFLGPEQECLTSPCVLSDEFFGAGNML